MRAIRTLLIGLASSTLWPLYLLLLSLATRLAPLPRPIARPLGFTFTALALALFLANVCRVILRPNGLAEVALHVPQPVVRQLRRATLGIVIAGLICLFPAAMLTQGLIAPGGAPVAAPTLSRILVLGFELVVWVVVFRLVRKRSALVEWQMQRPERLGWVGRHRRAAAIIVLGAIGAVIVLDAQGYGFTARRLAAAGSQSLALVALSSALYRLLLHAIDNHNWHWARSGAPLASHEHGESLEQPLELPRRLKHLARAIVPLCAILVGAWIWNVDLALFRSIGATPVWTLMKGGGALTVGDLIKAAAIFFVSIGAWMHIGTFFAVTIFPRMPDDPGVRFAVVTLCRYLVLGVGILAGLSAVHLGPDQIGMALAALGVGLGFGLQEIVSNFVSGVILLIERPIRVGDIVTVCSQTGRIDRINIRATTIINGDNQSIIVPNREFITGNLVNWTHRDRIIRVTINVGVAYGTCPDKVADLLLTIAREDADVLRNPVPSASLEGFGESALNFSLHVHVPDPSLAGRVKHRLISRIQDSFHEAGIAIPLPLHEVHVRSVPSGLTGLPIDSARLDNASATPPAPHMVTHLPSPVDDEPITRRADD